MSDLVLALQAARESYVREDYASNVKRLFREHIETLEPHAEIEDTLYFNHSAIPDFKVTWGRGSTGASSRDIFLRSSYATVVAGKETTQIRTGDPVFLSISAEQHVEERGFTMTGDDVSRTAREASHTLLTDADAFSEMSAPIVDSNPLSTAVRSNFLRGGRGLVDETIAERLRSTSNAREGSVTDLIRENFFEDAVYRMERTASLVEWALSPTTVDDELPNIDGSMSTEELRNVLPWILDKTTAPKGGKFWKTLGSLFNFEQLEELASDLSDYDLTNLVQANLATWSAKRAYLGLNTTSVDSTGEVAATQPAEEKEEEAAVEEASTEAVATKAVIPPDAWRFDAGTLSLPLGAAMVRVSNSGYKLKARPGSTTPKWSATADRLDDYEISSASVAGIERAFRVDARESGNVKNDLNKVVDSVQDTYFVSHLEVLLPGPLQDEKDEESRPVIVDFAGGISIANGPVQLGALVRATANILANKKLDEDLQSPTPDSTVADGPDSE